MAKITRIGNKEEILDRKKEYGNRENQLKWLNEIDKKELEQWCDNHFKDLPQNAKDGLETLTRSLWALSSKFSQKLG